MDGLAQLDTLLKAKAAGPFVGPRGGLWADAKHTVHWDTAQHGPGQMGLFDPKPKPKLKTLPGQSKAEARMLRLVDHLTEELKRKDLTEEELAKLEAKANRMVNTVEVRTPAERRLASRLEALSARIYREYMPKQQVEPRPRRYSAADLRVEKDPSGYYLKWRVMLGDKMESRYAAKRDAQAHIDILQGDIAKAPDFYKRRYEGASKRMPKEDAVRYAVMSAQLLGLKPHQVNADPETGFPIGHKDDPDAPTPEAAAAHEDKREDKIDRLRDRADKKRAEADRQFDRADMREEKSGIPMGQPILVGHHSERRHRRAIERANQAGRKGLEASEDAKRLARRADAMESGTAGISSDDPAAVVKLKKEIAAAENTRDKYKATNKALRKKGATPESVAEAMGMKVATARKLLEPDFAGRTGIPSYLLTNLGANIRRMTKRLDVLRAEAGREEAAPVEGEGFRIVEDKDDNRIRFFFDAKPPSEVRTKLKQAGFRWSPTVGAWQRQLNNSGRYAADRMRKELFPEPEAPAATVPAPAPKKALIDQIETKGPSEGGGYSMTLQGKTYNMAEVGKNLYEVWDMGDTEARHVGTFKDADPTLRSVRHSVALDWKEHYQEPGAPTEAAPTGKADTALWVKAPRFGAAGGPDRIQLTMEGVKRAFSVGAGVQQKHALALMTLSTRGGQGELTQPGPGARVWLTDLGRLMNVDTLTRLKGLGYVESDGRDAIKLTDAGKSAVERGRAEENTLLARIRGEQDPGLAKSQDKAGVAGGRRKVGPGRYEKIKQQTKDEDVGMEKSNAEIWDGLFKAMRGTPIGGITPGGKLRRVGKTEYVPIAEYKLQVHGEKKQATDVAKLLRQGVEKSADICKISPPICAGNLDIPRKYMPQIAGATETKFLDSLKDKGVKVEKGHLEAGKLMATQREIQAHKVVGMAHSFKEKKKDPKTGKTFDPTKGNILVSREGYILDGHHRYAAALMIDPSAKMEVTQIDMPIKDILSSALKFEGVGQADMQGKEITDPAERKKALTTVAAATPAAGARAEKSMDGIDELEQLLKGKVEIEIETDDDEEEEEGKEGGEDKAEKALPSEEASVSPAKAKQILRDGEVGGNPLTDKQRGMFGAIAGKAEKSMEKAGPFIGPRGGKWADAKHTIPWKSTGSKPAGKKAPASLPPVPTSGPSHSEVDAGSAWDMLVGPDRSEADVVREAQSEGVSVSAWVGDAITGGISAGMWSSLDRSDLQDHLMTTLKEAAVGAEKSMDGIESLEALVKGTGPTVGSTVTGTPQKGFGDAGALSGDNAAGTGALPHGDTKFSGRGPEDGGEAAGSPAGSPPTRSGGAESPGKKLSEDDEEVEGQMKGSDSPGHLRGGSKKMAHKSLDYGTPLTPSRQLDMAAHERAIRVSQIRKSERIRPGIGVTPAPVEAQEAPLEKAQTWKQGISVYSDASDLAVEELQKSEEFYHGASPTLDTTGNLRKSVQCANGHATSAMFKSCQTCGVGSGVATTTGGLMKSLAGLVRPQEQRIHIPNGAFVPDDE